MTFMTHYNFTRDLIARMWTHSSLYDLMGEARNLRAKRNTELLFKITSQLCSKYHKNICQVKTKCVRFKTLFRLMRGKGAEA